ncbi:AraC family transcriptional regulator [Helicobacter sp. 16-1353]|uniref:AraC family transcriptional regulator n=1 Tax=Helicobacter sp. 16-1353 TaxID=2004996 RepID=UPI000DCC40FA|nr:AraC family transcriptional regulator [Helicobacter sp. 16-1353]RAX54858.1 AraC family transcriptional regulator [Helicobacter sp. 16-1353]
MNKPTSRINEIIDELVDFILYQTPIDAENKIPSLDLFSRTNTDEFSLYIYQPSICFALQGTKSVSFAKNVYTYNKTKYLLVSTHVPAYVKILEASKQKPYVGISLKFTLEQIYDTLKDFDKNPINQKPSKGLYFGEANEELLEPILRLSKLLLSPQSHIDFMSPLIIKEILYILLSGNSGEFLKQYVINGSITNKIVKAILTIKSNFSNPINMRELAYQLDISESSLYHNFKRITALSPLQFQKKIRLEEAKQILLKQNINVSDVAFKVGYESPSQFSREYVRLFGIPPKKHIEQLKENAV